MLQYLQKSTVPLSQKDHKQDHLSSLFQLRMRVLIGHLKLGVFARPMEEGAEQAIQDEDALGQGGPGRKRGRTSGGASTASRRHIQTEQRRRDKINEGCAKG